MTSTGISFIIVKFNIYLVKILFNYNKVQFHSRFIGFFNKFQTNPLPCAILIDIFVA